jgi:hypothetical protein
MARIWKLLNTEVTSTLKLQFSKQMPEGAKDQERFQAISTWDG